MIARLALVQVEHRSEQETIFRLKPTKTMDGSLWCSSCCLIDCAKDRGGRQSPAIAALQLLYLHDCSTIDIRGLKGA